MLESMKNDLKEIYTKILTLSIGGAFITPFLMYIGMIEDSIYHPYIITTFQMLFNKTNFCILCILGILIFAYILYLLFSIEYNEDKYKNIINHQDLKKNFLVSRLKIFLALIIIFDVCTIFAVLLFGLIGGATDLTIDIILESFINLFCGSILIFLIMSPFIFFSIWKKSIIPLIFSIAVVVGINVSIMSQIWSYLFPWLLPCFLFGAKILKFDGRAITSLVILLITSIIGFIISCDFFMNKLKIE